MVRFMRGEKAYTDNSVHLRLKVGNIIPVEWKAFAVTIL